MQPLPAFVLSDGFEASPNRVLADDLLHAQKFGKHAVIPKRRDMGIALVSCQNREHRCPKHIALLRCVRAAIDQRTIGREPIEQARNLEIFDEEGQLPKGR